jgi:hypothetical protein
MRTYSEPVSSLLSVGTPTKWEFDEFPILEAGIGREHIPELLELANDTELISLPGDIPEIWGPIHAWCALAQLKAVEAIEPIQQLLMQQTEDSFGDWLFEYMPFVIVELGPQVISPMQKVLVNRDLCEYSRSLASEALSKLGQRDVEQRQACIEALVTPLQAPEFDNPAVLGFVMSALLDLRATEAADVMKQAFDKGCVDEFIAGDWEDVKYELEHGRPRSIPPRQPSPQPNLGFRSPEERKARNTARKKLERKAKAKKKR